MGMAMLLGKSAVDAKLSALCTLSDLKRSDFRKFYVKIKTAPDPETAIGTVLSRIQVESPNLNRQWRNLVTDVWLDYHPEAPVLPNWPLTINEAALGPNIRDSLTFLKQLIRKPAKMVHDSGEWLLAPEEVARFLKVMPSTTLGNLPAVENEWSYIALRRLREQLQAAGLIRVWKGHLCLVKSHINQFLSLPAFQQYYILWHADTYHVNWAAFAGLWREHMRVVQEYLPLLWETIGEVQAGDVKDRMSWVMSVIETFMPLWEDEGVFQQSPHTKTALHVIKQQALPSIIDRFILRDLLERHGLVRIGEDVQSMSRFIWTSGGAKIIAAEAGQQLPCGNDLLKTKVKRKKNIRHR